jgi:hypothetical protein
VSTSVCDALEHPGVLSERRRGHGPPSTCQNQPMSEPHVRTIALDPDVVLVLFGLLHRWEDDGRPSEPSDAAERIALADLTAALEPLVEVAFSSDYGSQLQAAKRRLSGTER